MLSACRVDLPLSGDPGYSCYEPTDCLPGFLCVGATGDLPGTCIEEGGAAPADCDDVDGDGTFVGSTCTDQLIDCDDTTVDRSPNGSESCDGLDNDCDCTGDSNGDGTVCGPGDEGVDEDLPRRPCPLQTGVCAGANRACEDGAYADCQTAGLYGPDFELVELTCDDLDNDCSGEADEQCECAPGTDFAEECLTETGACSRGIRLCLENGTRSGCISAPEGRVCSDGSECAEDADCAGDGVCGPELCDTSADCGEGGFCTEEDLDDSEDLFDACEAGSALNCTRSVCRYPAAGPACDDATPCAAGTCAGGQCRTAAVAPVTETCNGLDDDCDGAIDNDPQRSSICGPCPFNSAFLSITPLAGPPGTNSFICVDHYEASRPDATADSAGSLELYTIPRAGVLPWTGIAPDEAESICRAEPIRELVRASVTPLAIRRLCKTFEWKQACGGTTGTAAERRYPYSESRTEDVYVAGACIDGSLSATGPALTGATDTCCRVDSSTGAPLCDFVGNVGEFVLSASSTAVIAGGGFSDTDPDVLSCGDGVSYIAVPFDVTDRDDVGFRCCTERARTP